MVLASGTGVGLSYVVETTHGTTPGSPTMLELRSTQRNINLTKNILTTQEVRSDRMIADSRHGFNQVEGSIGFELSIAAYDDMLAAAMGQSAWTAGTTVDTGVTTLSATSTGNKFTRGAGSFVTDGFVEGMWITSSNFTNAANNGNHLVTAVAATELTVTTTLVTETGDADEQIVCMGNFLKVGTTLTTFTFERRFTDITKYDVFKGVAINSMSLNINPEDIVGGTFDLIGMSASARSGTSLGSPTAAATNSPFAAFDGAVYEGGTAIAVVTSIDFTLNNNRSIEGVVGSNFSPDVFDGQAIVSGNISLFLEDTDIFYDKFFNETESSIYLTLNDSAGTDWIAITFPRVKINSADINPPQQGPITIDATFEAIRDTAASTSIMVQRTN